MSEKCDVCLDKEVDLFVGNSEYCNDCYWRLEKEGARKEIILKLLVWCPLPAEYVGKRIVEQYQENIDKAGGDYMEIPIDDTGKKWTGVTLGKAELVRAVPVIVSPTGGESESEIPFWANNEAYREALQSQLYDTKCRIDSLKKELEVLEAREEAIESVLKEVLSETNNG